MSDIHTPDPETGNQGDVPVTEKQGGSLLTGLTINETAEATPDKPASQDETKDAKPQRPAWMAQLPKDLQEDDTLTRFKTIGEIGKAYRELEGKIGNSIPIPGKDATAEELEAYFTKIGRPDKPESYNLSKLELPEGLEYDDNLAETFRKKAHSLGLTQAQADKLYGWQIETTVQAYKDRHADMRLDAADSMKKLREVYGSKTNEEIALTTRFLKQAADKIDPALVKDIEKSGLGNSVALMRLLNTFAHATGEDTFTGEGSGKDDTNPGMFSYPGI